MSAPDEIPGDDSFFDFNCPYCGNVNSFPATAARTLQECASCFESVIVPEAGAATGGKLPLPITTERLVLRRFIPADAARLLDLADKDESSLLMVNEMNVDAWIEDQRTTRFTHDEFRVTLAIELSASHELIGYVMVYYTDAARNTVGFKLMISPALRRQGLGLEAAAAMLNFAFDGLCAHRVSVSCASESAAGRGLLAKAGLRQEGEFVKSWFDGQEWKNVSWYAKLAEERSSLS